ncbi:MAG: MBOAT family protein, partial [Clostridia bacterium]|nr:MBOAT family protein [Clostridia bacterium]
MTLSKLFMAGHFASTLTNMMSMTFLCFFLPMTLLVFTIVPKKIKKYALLVISYGFSWLISGKLAAFLLLSTLSIHYFSLWIERLHRQQADALKAAEKDAKKTIKASFIRKKKGVICFAVILHFGLLLGLKYSAFITV